MNIGFWTVVKVWAAWTLVPILFALGFFFLCLVYAACEKHNKESE